MDLHYLNFAFGSEIRSLLTAAAFALWAGGAVAALAAIAIAFKRIDRNL